MKKHSMKNEDGKFDSHAWPGGYPIYYLTADNGVLCPDCANGSNNSDTSEDSDDPQWKLVNKDIHWEGEPLICDHCNSSINSAYGNDNKGEL